MPLSRHLSRAQALGNAPAVLKIPVISAITAELRSLLPQVNGPVPAAQRTQAISAAAAAQRDPPLTGPAPAAQ